MKLFIHTKPNSKEERVTKIDENSFEVAVKEPPDKGKANRALVKALARFLKVPNSSIVIKAGHTARNKIVEVL